MEYHEKDLYIQVPWMDQDSALCETHEEKKDIIMWALKHFEKFLTKNLVYLRLFAFCFLTYVLSIQTFLGSGFY